MTIAYYEVIILKLVIISSLITGLWFLYYYTRPIKRDLFKFELKHFYLNWIYIFTYIFGYFGLLIYLRYKHLDQISDLKPFLTIIKLKYVNLSLFNFSYLIIFCCLILCYLICLVYFMHKFFITQLLKRYLLFIDFIPNDDTYLISGLSNRMCDIFRYVLRIIEKFLHVKTPHKIYIFFIKCCMFIVMTGPTIILIIYFIYEMKYNNYVLSSNFQKYLLFYFLYSLYKRFSIFYERSDRVICKMIYEMYYKQGSVMYVNIPDELENVIYEFVDDGLYRNPEVKPVSSIDDILGQFTLIIILNHLYISEDRYVYKNASGEGFVEENNTRYDVKLSEYKYIKKLYKMAGHLLYGTNSSHKNDEK